MCLTMKNFVDAYCNDYKLKIFLTSKSKIQNGTKAFVFLYILR